MLRGQSLLWTVIEKKIDSEREEEKILLQLLEWINNKNNCYIQIKETTPGTAKRTGVVGNVDLPVKAEHT